MYANFFFRQTLLSHELWHDWNEKNYSNKRIINIGSTTDTVRRGKTNRYHHEKLALKEMSNSLSIVGVWGNGPKVSHISFGTLSNKQEKHPNRNTIDLLTASKYIEWLILQPKDVNINIISIDPIQRPEASSLSNNSAAIITGENNG
jgi:NADP-dependent 3-hydroxy acid dehydrogenase YdfG